MARNQPSGRVPGAKTTAPSAAPGSPAERDQTDAYSDDHQDRADDGPHRVAGHCGATHHPRPCSAQTAPITINTAATISMTIFIRYFFRPGPRRRGDDRQLSRQPSADGQSALRWCHAAARNAEYHVGRLTRNRSAPVNLNPIDWIIDGSLVWIRPAPGRRGFDPRWPHQPGVLKAARQLIRIVLTGDRLTLAVVRTASPARAVTPSTAPPVDPGGLCQGDVHPAQWAVQPPSTGRTAPVR